jgi:hypothetical protein
LAPLYLRLSRSLSLVLVLLWLWAAISDVRFEPVCLTSSLPSSSGLPFVLCLSM